MLAWLCHRCSDLSAQGNTRGHSGVKKPENQCGDMHHCSITPPRSPPPPSNCHQVTSYIGAGPWLSHVLSVHTDGRRNKSVLAEILMCVPPLADARCKWTYNNNNIMDCFHQIYIRYMECRYVSSYGLLTVAAHIYIYIYIYINSHPWYNLPTSTRSLINFTGWYYWDEVQQ